MIKITIFFILILPFSLLADVTNDAQVSLCEKASRGFGNGEGVDHIPSGCHALFTSLANPQAKKESSDKLRVISGYRNMIFLASKIPGTKVPDLIAGEYTGLIAVKAIALDEVNRELAVLEESGDILIFSSVITGNVAPLRVIRHSELDGATDLIALPEREEIAVLHGPKRELLFFSRLGNFHGPEGKKNLSIRRQVRNIAGESLGMVPDRSAIVIRKKTGDSRYDLSGK